MAGWAGLELVKTGTAVLHSRCSRTCGRKVRYYFRDKTRRAYLVYSQYFGFMDCGYFEYAQYIFRGSLLRILINDL